MLFPKILFKPLALLVALTSTISTLWPAFALAAAAQSSADLLARARDLYRTAQFSEAVSMLRPTIEQGQLTGAELIDGRQLLARSYVRLGQPDSARASFYSVLAQDSTWRPDPVSVSRDEQSVFNDALAKFRVDHPSLRTATEIGIPETVVPLWKQKRVWIPAAAIAAATTAVLIWCPWCTEDPTTPLGELGNPPNPPTAAHRP